MRRVGVEEEYQLGYQPQFEPALRAGMFASIASAKSELFDFQIEGVTKPTTGAEELVRELCAIRQVCHERATEVGCRIFASGFHPMTLPGQSHYIGNTSDYETAIALFGASLTDHHAAGVHVHVEVDSEDEAIKVTRRIRPWLPLLLAISVNSPFAAKSLTPYRSFRHISYQRIPTYGPPPASLTRDSLAETRELLAQRGLGEGSTQLYWLARPSAVYGTVEVRSFDSPVQVGDTVAYALLTRALVDYLSSSDERDIPRVNDLMLNLALHDAAASGLSGQVIDPVSGEWRGGLRALQNVLGVLLPLLSRVESSFVEAWAGSRNDSRRSAQTSAAKYAQEASAGFLHVSKGLRRVLG